MKSLKVLAMLAAIPLLASISTSCDDNDDVVTPPPVNLGYTAVADDSFDLIVASKNYDKVTYVVDRYYSKDGASYKDAACTQPYSAPTVDEVLSSGTEIRDVLENTSIKGLAPFANYIVHVAAQGKGGKTMRSIAVSTLAHVNEVTFTSAELIKTAQGEKTTDFVVRFKGGKYDVTVAIESAKPDYLTEGSTPVKVGLEDANPENALTVSGTATTAIGSVTVAYDRDEDGKLLSASIGEITVVLTMGDGTQVLSGTWKGNIDGIDIPEDVK